jgi:hypothetical protein
MKPSHERYAQRPLNGGERRSVCRYASLGSRGWLGWWEGEVFRSTDACLVDISLRGCMMTVDRLPPQGETVWFCPPGTIPAEWIEARLIESRRRLLGPRVVRIEFRNPFPYETFKHLVYGPDALRGKTAEGQCVPESERDFW